MKDAHYTANLRNCTVNQIKSYSSQWVVGSQ